MMHHTTKLDNNVALKDQGRQKKADLVENALKKN